jgi:hypothetical protein
LGRGKIRGNSVDFFAFGFRKKKCPGKSGEEGRGGELARAGNCFQFFYIYRLNTFAVVFLTGNTIDLFNEKSNLCKAFF